MHSSLVLLTIVAQAKAGMFGRRVAQHNVLADVAVVGVRGLVHVPEGDRFARQPVVLLQPASKVSEAARNLALGRQVPGRGDLDEGALLAREFEPVDQRRGGRERLPVDELLAVHSEPEPEQDEQLGVRQIAARNASGLLFVKALGKLDALRGVGTARVQRRGWDESAGEIIPPYLKGGAARLKGVPRAQPHGPCREARRRETRRRPYTH